MAICCNKKENKVHIPLQITENHNNSFLHLFLGDFNLPQVTSEVGENENADRLVKNKVLTKSMCFEYVLKKNMS